MAGDKNQEIMLKKVRISFAHLFKPDPIYDDKTKELTGYSFKVSSLIPKLLPDGSINPQAKIISDAIKAAIEAKWGDNKPMIPADRRCFRDGEPVDPDSGEKTPLYDGYAGHYYLSSNQRVSIADWEEHRKNPIQLLDSRKGPDGKFPRLKESDGKLYSGCFADVLVRIYAYDGTKGGHPHRVNAALEAVKFVSHGEAFGAKPVDADSAFDEEDSEDGFDDVGSAAATTSAASAEDDLLG